MRRLWSALRRLGSDRRGFSDYVALAIATPLALMGFVGGSAITETVSAQAALHTAAGMADRSLVANGCLTSNALQAMDATLQAAHMNPGRMTLKTATTGSGLYGSRGLAVQVGYQIPLAIPGTPWVLTSRYATAQVANDQSQAVPYDGAGQSACASASLVAATFSGTAGTSGGGSSAQLPPEPTAVSETVTPNPDGVGSALTVSGLVTSNGTPMADVPVAVAVGSQTSTTVSTNAQGQYSATLTPTQAGSATVTVTAGPATNQATVTIQPLAPASITLNVPASVTVGQEFAIAGTVLATNGQPVANGTHVTVSSSDATDIPTQTVTTVGGQFTVSVPSGITTLGTVTVAATAGSVTQSAPITVQPGPPESVTLALSPSSGPAGHAWTFSGTVEGPDQTPVASATPVSLTSSTDTRDTLPTLQTNAQGQFSGSVTLTQAGSQAFTAQAGTAQSPPVTVQVNPGPPVQVASMQAAPNPVNQGATTVISGTVLDAYGNPEPAGVPITLTSTAWSQSVTTTTGSGGVFQVPVSFTQSGNQVVQAAAGSTPLENGTTTVSVNAEGAYTLSATPASTTMTAGQTQTVTWTLTDSQGNPVPNIVLTFRATPSSGTTLSETSGTTNSQGQVTMTVSATTAGTLTVTATAATSPNTSGTATWVVNPATPKTVDPPTISPSVVQSTQDGGSVIPVVTGLVLDRYGNPVANATVSVAGGWDPGVSFTGTANAQGYFSIPVQPVDVGGPYYPTITVSDSAGSNTTTYTDTSLTVVTQMYALTLTPTSGSSITPAGTPVGVQVSLSAYGPNSGAPVPNATVTLEVSSSDTGYWAAGTTAPTPSSPQTITVTTNSQGTALAEVALEPNTGQQVITGSWATDNTTGTLDVLVTANSPAEAAWQSVSPNPVTAGQTLTWAAQLLDADGFPLSSGQTGSWTFDNTSGTATTGSWNGLNGVATGSGTPTTAGSFPVSLTLDGQTYTSSSVTVNPGPVQFLYPVLGPANNTNGTLLPGGSWNAGTDTMSYGTLPPSAGSTFSTRWTAYDAYGNAVPDWATGTVTCAASNGGSCPSMTQPSQPTNSHGDSGWANEGPFPAGSYTLTYTPSGASTSASSVVSHLTMTIQVPFYAFISSNQPSQATAWPLSSASPWYNVTTGFKVNSVYDVVSANGQTFGISAATHTVMALVHGTWQPSHVLGSTQVQVLHMTPSGALYGYLLNPTGVFFYSGGHLDTLTTFAQGVGPGPAYNPSNWPWLIEYVKPWVVFWAHWTETVSECSSCTPQTYYYTSLASWDPSSGRSQLLNVVGTVDTSGFYTESANLAYTLIPAGGGTAYFFNNSINYGYSPPQTSTSEYIQTFNTSTGTFSGNTDVQLAMMGSWGWQDPQTGGVLYQENSSSTLVLVTPNGNVNATGNVNSYILPGEPASGVAPYWNAGQDVLAVPWQNGSTGTAGVVALTGGGSPISTRFADLTTPPTIGGLAGP
ncbi:MAG: Ig-like domain-containing protein [Thermaerobacter sp.]|nr:Ig-like domain-containing protein [Thermaerobacter sp.]